MRGFGVLAGTGAMLLAIASASPGQRVARTTTLPDFALSQAGLEVAWQTHVTLDSARGEISFVTMDLNGTNARTVYDVVDTSGKVLQSFQAGQLDPRGRVVDSEGARRLADVELRVLKARGTEAAIEERTVADLALFVQTSQGTLQAIDAETGSTRWMLTPGNRSYPNQKPGVSDRHTAIINGSTLYVYDLQENKIAWKQTLGGAPGAGAAVSDRYVYAPLLNGMVEVYSLGERPTPKSVVSSSGRAMIQPTISPHCLSWATDNGKLFGVDKMTRSNRFRYDTASSVVAPSVFLPPDRLLVACTDGYVHCLHEQNGKLQWRFSCGESVVKPPLIVEGGVFITTIDGSLFRLDVSSGTEVWWTKGVEEVIAASADRLYGRDPFGNLVVLDIAHGTKLATVPIDDMDAEIFNALTDRIYLASKNGRIVCLRSIGQPWPMLHAAAKQELAEAQERLHGRSPDAAAVESPAAAEPALEDPVDDGSGTFGPADEGAAPFQFNDGDSTDADPFNVEGDKEEGDGTDLNGLFGT